MSYDNSYCSQNNSLEYDTVQNFFDFITLDEKGKIASEHHNFKNTINMLYHETTPERFETMYNLFLTTELKNRQNRKFIRGYYGEERITCIKRIYNNTKKCEQNPKDTRDAYFIFVLKLWLEIWKKN